IAREDAFQHRCDRAEMGFGTALLGKHDAVTGRPMLVQQQTLYELDQRGQIGCGWVEQRPVFAGSGHRGRTRIEVEDLSFRHLSAHGVSSSCRDEDRAGGLVKLHGDAKLDALLKAASTGLTDESAAKIV